MMNSLKPIALLPLLLFFASSTRAQLEPRQQKKITDIEVTNLEIKDKNVNHLLAEIAYKYYVPMSLEVATNEDLLKQHMSVKFEKGTLADLLNTIVKQKTAYLWTATDTTISVFPKIKFRDPLLQTVLKMRIPHFVVKKGTVKLTFRTALSESRELKDLLASYGVSPMIETFSSFDIRPFDSDFSLDLENASVGSILNNVVENSRTKYWFINRHGKNREYLLINF